LEECRQEQGQLAEASEEGLGSKGAVVPMMMMIPQNKNQISVDVFTFMGEVYVPVSIQNQNCIFHS